MLPATLFAAPLSDTVSLTDNTFTWSDEGWYQVQSSSDYATICGGGSSCTVEPGVYHVINHSTGVRLEFVTVPAETVESVTVSGSTISWPDDGWYQVQDADTYQSLCQGGRSCDVPAGNYIVINHTTGQRHTGITVDDTGTPGLAAIDRDNYLAMLTQAFEVYMGTAYDERLPTIFMNRLETNGYVETREPGEGIVHEVIKRLYACHNGGTVERTGYTGISPIIAYSYSVDDCQYQGEVINGEWSIEGYRTTSHSDISVDDFTVEFSPQGTMTVNGNYRRYSGFFGYGNSPYDYTRHWRTKKLDYHLSYAEGSLSIEDATTLGWYGYTGYAYVDDETFWNYQASMSGDFTMKPPFQPDTTITVSTPTNFTEQRLEAYSERPPYVTPPLPRFDAGVLLLVADDGSTLQLDADNNDAASARITILNADGEESFDLPWSSLDGAMALRSSTISWPRE